MSLGVETSEPIMVRPGEDYYMRADITSGESRMGPVKLGVRIRGDNLAGVAAGSLPTQLGLTPMAHGVTKRNDERRWPLEGIYTVPKGVQSVRVVVWRPGVRPQASAAFVLDEVRFVRVTPRTPGGRVRPSRVLAYYLAPTYLAPSYGDVVRLEESYRAFVDVAPELLTNSSFAAMYSALGYGSFALIAAVSLVAGGLAGHAWGYTSYFFLVALSVGYAFLELWRLFLFNRGIVHFLILILLLIPIGDAGARWSLKSLRRVG
jgi:hypothetical protein